VNILRKMLRHYFQVWSRMQRILSMVLLVVLAAVLISRVGLVREIREICPATVFTEDGRILTCDVEAQGELTRYPLRRKTSVDSVSFWAENRLVVEFPSNIGNYSNRFAGILNQKEKAVVAELELNILFPEAEKQRCVIIIPSADRDAALALLEKGRADGYDLTPFGWFLDAQSDTAADSADGPVLITENQLGTVEGYDYELWKDHGTTEMFLTGGGTFTCNWSDINNALFRIGRKFDCTRTWEEIGTITVDYGADYYPVGNSYLCIYGWTREPLVEYYVVQSWGNWRPPGAEAVDTVEIGDSTYDIYKTQRVNQPSIDGTQTFDQYWSVRKGKRTEDTICVTDHFRAWQEQGLELGKLYEVALTVEGFQSSGTAKVYRNIIHIEAPES